MRLGSNMKVGSSYWEFVIQGAIQVDDLAMIL